MDTHVLLIRLEVNGRVISEDGGQSGPVAVIGKQFRWKGTDADMVELISGLHLRGVIEVEGRPADIKEIAELFGNCFGRELSNVYYTRMMNQKRKKDKTPFLNSLVRVMVGGGDCNE